MNRILLYHSAESPEGEVRKWWNKEVDELHVEDILEMDSWFAQLTRELEKGERRPTLEEIRRSDMVLELTERNIRSKEEKRGRTKERPVEYDYVFKIPRLKAEFEEYERRPQEERWAREAAGLSLPWKFTFPKEGNVTGLIVLELNGPGEVTCHRGLRRA